MKVIKTLKDHRIEKQLLQKDVAKKANISKSFYSLIESGHRSCSIDTASKISEVLDLSLNEFHNLLKKK